MAQYLRRAGSGFARALAALGAWCSGVTSDNANIRSDMYKQLVTQIRGTSTHFRRAGETILQDHVHGMWVQLVDDFSIQREECTPNDTILYTFHADVGNSRYENAAQLIGVILSNPRFLEKLDILDVQTLILETVTRVNHHLQNKLPLDVPLSFGCANYRLVSKVISGFLGVKLMDGGRRKPPSTLKVYVKGCTK
jgi:hypothetical protein